MLRGGRAVEQQRVAAGLALDDVAAVARIPHERVVARAQERLVVAAVAVDCVVAVAADQLLGAPAAADRSLPAPPSRVRAIDCAAIAAAEIPSLPSRPLTVSESVGSWCWMATTAARPVTATPLTAIASSRLVPLTTTLSGWPSPAVPPRAPARSALTFVTPVPVRSFTVTASAPPSALKSTVSTPFVSIVMLLGSRKNRSR